MLKRTERGGGEETEVGKRPLEAWKVQGKCISHILYPCLLGTEPSPANRHRESASPFWPNWER